MKQEGIGKLIRFLPPISLQDPASRAVALLQAGLVGALPVVAGGRFLGLVSERDLLPWIASWGRGKGRGAGAGETRLPLRGLEGLVRPALSVPETTSLEEAIVLFEKHPELEVLPVVSGEGVYRGAVTRRDLFSSLYHRIRPPVIGGMATPVGVYLTTGHRRGGVGDGALFLTGLEMAGLLGLTYLLLFSLGWLMEGVGGGFFHLLLVSQELMRWSEDPSLWSRWFPHGPSFWSIGIPLMIIPGTLLLLLRWSSLAGFHAGEHQVVHALEKGIPLRLEEVQKMPRAHPRCGTNLVVVFYAVMVCGVLLYVDFPWEMVLPFTGLVGIFRKPIGRALQNLFTTRPATNLQLESGIRAALELLERYQTDPQFRAGWGRRFWNRGFIQVLAGLGSGIGLLYVGYHFLLQRILGFFTL